jgi:cellulose synthase/poly-beta-1,6-N-acetylglucosamine synthase-like glycosyltransferase
MLTVSLVLTLIMFLLTFINAQSIRIPRNGRDLSASVAVLLPVRNEAANIVELANSLKAQTGISDLKFYFLDDNSEDETLELLQREVSGDQRFTITSGQQLPEGWLGKPWALEQLRSKAKADFIVNIDADVRLTPKAICATLNLLIEQELDFVSPYPKQIAKSFGERMVQPLLQWSWLSTVPLRLAEKSGRPALAVANGQFFAVRESALSVVSGYSASKTAVLDDMELARTLLRNGFKGCVAEGSHIATCHMYNSWAEVKAGYGKSLWSAFGSRYGSFLAIAFLLLTGILPLVGAITGFAAGFYALEFVIVSRIIAARVSRGRFLDAFLHPISALLLIYLIIYSWNARGKVQWKGRTL